MSEVKEGAKTSENAVSKGAMWIAVLVAVLSAAGGIMQQWDSPWASVIGLSTSAVGAALVALGYTAGRVLIKHQAIKAGASKVDWGEIIDLIVQAVNASKEDKEGKTDASADRGAGGSGDSVSGVGQTGGVS